MEEFLKLVILLFVLGFTTINCMIDEPRCYSRFDWEDKLLEKTIRTEIKVQQFIEKIDLAMAEIQGQKQAFLEWKQKAEMDVKEHQTTVRKTLSDFAKNLTPLQDGITKVTGTTYTIWGRSSCPGKDPESVYDGFAGGSRYSHTGAAASMLCLPKDPDWDAGKYSDKLDSYTGYIYGAEYQDGQGRSDQLFEVSHYEQDVPCAVCSVSTRSSTIMIAGKTSCHAGWTVEYTGYLMTGKHDHAAASDYYCVSNDPENLPDGATNHNGYLLYFVESRCGSLKCPPYVEGREMQCVVCTK